MYIYMCVQFQKLLAQIRKKEICLPNKQSISGHKCERINMATKCEMFMKCSKNLKKTQI